MISSRLPSAIIRNSGKVQGEHSCLAPWWSITKSVLATAVLKLIDLGAMRLDAFFEDWPFTIRQLLQHTSGLTNYGGPAYQRAVRQETRCGQSMNYSLGAMQGDYCPRPASNGHIPTLGICSCDN